MTNEQLNEITDLLLLSCEEKAATRPSFGIVYDLMETCPALISADKTVLNYLTRIAHNKIISMGYDHRVKHIHTPQHSHREQKKHPTKVTREQLVMMSIGGVAKHTLLFTDPKTKGNASAFFMEYPRGPFRNVCTFCQQDATTFMLPSNLTNYILSDCFPVCEKHNNLQYAQINTQISKEFKFDAAHHLPDYDGLCAFSHGHTWKLIVHVNTYVKPDTGMALDFKELKEIVERTVISKLDHNYINEFLWNPTAEHLTYWIWEQLMEAGLTGLSQIELYESPSSKAVLTATMYRDTVRTSIIKTEG